MLGAPLREYCPRGHRMADVRKRHPNGDTYCSTCKQLRSTAYRNLYPERAKQYARTSSVRVRYGVEWETLEGRPCGICGTDSFNARGPNVDHDHATGQVRGVLCHNCNTGLGLLGEENLERAMTYLRGER